MPLSVIPDRWEDRYDCGDKMILVSAELLLRFIEGASPDMDFTVEWGEPRADAVVFYEPVFTAWPK